MVAGQRVGDFLVPQELRARILEALGGLLWEEEDDHSNDDNCCPTTAGLVVLLVVVVVAGGGGPGGGCGLGGPLSPPCQRRCCCSYSIPFCFSMSSSSTSSCAGRQSNCLGRVSLLI